METKSETTNHAFRAAILAALGHAPDAIEANRFLSLSSTDNAARVSALAESLEHLTEDDFSLLAGIKVSTAEAWRKRGKGPAYVLIGNRYLYPRAAIAEYMRGLVRARSSTSAKGML